MIFFFLFAAVTFPKVSRFDGLDVFPFRRVTPPVTDNQILWDDSTAILWDDSTAILWDD